MTRTATFAGGCFWGVEASLRRLPGVVATAAGYMGGTRDHPTYAEVCTDRTGHAEVVQVTYDPDRVGYGDLLDAFWQLHDPTQVDRQGPDVGRQYRSAIFTHDEDQAVRARASRDRVQRGLGRPVATAIEPASTFWPAEDTHQQYLEKRGLASCHLTPAAG